MFNGDLRIQATCPAGENESLSPDEVSEIVRSRLSKQDMTPDGGCSMGFKSSIEQFLDEYVKALRKTQETFLLNQSPGWKVKSATLEKIVQNISGVTSRQLKVLVIFYVLLAGHFVSSLSFLYYIEGGVVWNCEFTFQ